MIELEKELEFDSMKFLYENCKTPNSSVILAKQSIFRKAKNFLKKITEIFQQ